jgi:hypothetical protein
MKIQGNTPQEREDFFQHFLVDEYFKCGTVEEVFRKYKYELPISYANYQRILGKWGIVKAAGPNSKITEIINFVSHLAMDSISVEDLYKKMPPSFQTSLSTIYRVLSYMKEGLTRRIGCALLISPYNFKEKILLGRDVSVPRLELGKPYGSLSIPMGFARKRDGRKTNILRILQQEVFTKAVVEKTFPSDILQSNFEPFMYLDIVDVRVAVYHIGLPKNDSMVNHFSSYKLKDFKYWNVGDLKSPGDVSLRAGVKEIAIGYEKYLGLIDRNIVVNPFQIRSSFNSELAKVLLEY